MKRFSRLFAMLMAVIMVVSSLCIVASAEGEDAEEATTAAPKPELPQANIMDQWDPEVFGNLFTSGGNQTKASLTDEGLLLEYTGDEDTAPDPYYTFNISGYYKKTATAAPKPEDCNYMVVKMKCEGCDNLFEMFAKAEAGDSETVEYAEEDMNDDGWYYLIFDMEFTSLVEQRKLQTVRMDWSCGGTTVGAKMTIAAIGFFKEEDDAYKYAGIEIVTMAPKTKAPATEAPAPATEEPTEAPAPETEAPKGGCGAIVASGAVVVMMAAAAAVALKKH